MPVRTRSAPAGPPAARNPERVHFLAARAPLEQPRLSGTFGPPREDTYHLFSGGRSRARASFHRPRWLPKRNEPLRRNGTGSGSYYVPAIAWTAHGLFLTVLPPSHNGNCKRRRQKDRLRCNWIQGFDACCERMVQAENSHHDQPCIATTITRRRPMILRPETRVTSRIG